MQRKSEFWLIGAIIFTIISLLTTSFLASSSFEKIDDYFLYNIIEEFGRCVNIENCTLRNFTDFVRFVCYERSYNLSLIYFYCNITHLEIGNFYNRDINVTINSEIGSTNLIILDNQTIFYELSEIGKYLNISYPAGEIHLTCNKKTIARDICLSFLNTLKCFSDIS
ncbi:MAG: hypothetical protein OH319_00025 [Candidatus Parvarchaeota archaeon]|nr:hypothetical protein [Candidatus Jingweiarchaeum tengchongense]MCW1298464.1 hypothetical protein [Candidatus Jingweiarchaeum tengchongense]MCW1300556.1 hypothetical protein [Candidatus Jingweiarchaeum tengchongense]MCW1304969.1 hypothetical protein [Candidatus Jingweiarchaeum tengchongense]MCW1309306.1 hypothetical protein [Candidatus Jingweiarchaeum tengchongense]